MTEKQILILAETGRLHQLGIEDVHFYLEFLMVGHLQDQLQMTSLAERECQPHSAVPSSPSGCTAVSLRLFLLLWRLWQS